MKKYDLMTKYLISKSGNPYYLPEMNVPVSTAKYWIKKKVHLEIASQLKINPHHEFLKKKNEKLCEEIRELKKKIDTFKYVYKELRLTPEFHNITDKEAKKNIVTFIERNKGRKGIYNSLRELGIHPNKFKRWRREIKNEQVFQIENYFQKYPRSLTFKELLILKSYYQNKKLFHFPFGSKNHYFNNLGNTLSSTTSLPLNETAYAMALFRFSLISLNN